MSTEQGAAPATMTVKLGDDFEVTVERPNGLKSARAFAIMRSVSDRLPEIAEAWGTYQREYQATHSREVDRGYAMLRWGPQPLVNERGVVLYPASDEQGNPHPRAGEVVMVPSPLTAISEEGWAARGQKMTVPEDPPTAQLVAAVFDKALEVAERHVYRLVALFTLTNDSVNAAWRKNEGELDKLIDERVDELLTRSYGDELIELAVVCGECVETSFVGKVRRLLQSGRMTNLLRLVGLARPARQTTAEEPQTPDSGDVENTETPSTTPPASSSDSPASSDGPGETPSTPPMTSLSPSPAGSTSGTPGSESE